MVLAWIAALVAVAMLAPLLADDAASDFSTPDSESARVEQLLATEFPGRTGDTLTVTWEAPDAAAQLPTIERLATEAATLAGRGRVATAALLARRHDRGRPDHALRARLQHPRRDR